MVKLAYYIYISCCTVISWVLVFGCWFGLVLVLWGVCLVGFLFLFRIIMCPYLDIFPESILTNFGSSS